MAEVLRPGLERFSVKLQVIGQLNKRVPKRMRIEIRQSRSRAEFAENLAYRIYYPPAKPGALGLWPLEAASLTRLSKGWPLRRAARGDADAAPSKSSA
jgi:hypothetical protein